MSPRLSITITASLAFGLSACYGGGGPPSGDEDTDSGSSGVADPTAVDDETGGPDDPTSDDDDSGDPPAKPQQAPSARSNVKPKAPGVLARDLAAALEIPLEELCLELSSIDCFDAHNIALGGVDPYHSAVFEPLPEPGVSSPIAVDRIALSACGERVAREFAGDAALFVEIQGGADDPGNRQVVAERLYQHLLRRDGEPEEVQAVVDFWDALPEQDAKTWAQLSCFALATSVENLFY